MTSESLVESLLDFGFSRPEADVYTFLLKTGPCTARIISRSFDINRMRTYRILKNLEQKDLVDRILGRPVKFVAKDLKRTLSRQIEEMKLKVSNLEKSEKEIIENYERISSLVEPLYEEPKFRIVQGRQQIYDFLMQVFERAEKEIRIVTTMNDLYRLTLLNIDNKMRTLANEGIKIYVLAQIEEKWFEEVENFLNFLEIRHMVLPAPIRFIIIDEKETLSTVAMDDSMSMTTQEDTGLWTDASSYVTVMKIFFNSLWRLSLEAQEIVHAIKTGRELEEIRLIRTEKEYQETFSKIMRARTQAIQKRTRAKRER